MGRAYAKLYQNPLTHSMNPTDPIPKIHQTKGLTWCRSENMSWALNLLQDSETLQTYQEYTKESAYEADGAQPRPPPTPPNRKHQNPLLPPGVGGLTNRNQRTGHPNQGKGNPPIRSTSMDVDQND